MFLYFNFAQEYIYSYIHILFKTYDSQFQPDAYFYGAIEYK